MLKSYNGRVKVVKSTPVISTGESGGESAITVWSSWIYTMAVDERVDSVMIELKLNEKPLRIILSTEIGHCLIFDTSIKQDQIFSEIISQMEPCGFFANQNSKKVGKSILCRFEKNREVSVTPLENVVFVYDDREAQKIQDLFERKITKYVASTPNFVSAAALTAQTERLGISAGSSGYYVPNNSWATSSSSTSVSNLMGNGGEAIPTTAQVSTVHTSSMGGSIVFDAVVDSVLQAIALPLGGDETLSLGDRTAVPITNSNYI